MTYIDGFVLPLKKKNLSAYLRMARLGAKVWKDHGALEYHECVGDDLIVKPMLPFTKLVAALPGETVIFAWIVYRSRAHRDRVTAKVMKDPRLSKFAQDMPFDFTRMAYGGFKTMVKR